MRGLRVPAAAMLAAILAVGATTSVTAAGACPAIDYQAGLAAAAAALEEGPPDIGAAQRTVVALEARDAGSAIALQPVLDDLAAVPANVRDARVRLASMSSVLAYPRGSVCEENGSAARSVLRTVYGSPDFRQLDQVGSTSLLASILNAIANLLSRGAGALGPAGAVLLAAAVLAVALSLAWRRWRGAAAVRDARVAEPATIGDDPDDEWRAAEHAAAAGEFREAVRRGFRSALLEVALRGRVRLDAAWTTRELLQRIDATGEVLAALAACAGSFERAWYSGGEVTSGDWSVARQRCEMVRRMARRAGAAVR